MKARSQRIVVITWKLRFLGEGRMKHEKLLICIYTKSFHLSNSPSELPRIILL
jgi:hypothetical protein